MATFSKNPDFSAGFLCRLRPRRLSLKTRLTALFVLIFGATTLAFSAFVYYSLNDSLLQDFDNALYNYAIDVTKSIESVPASELIFPLLPLDEDKIFPFASGKSLILIRHISGEVITQTDGFGRLEFPYHEQIREIAGGADSSYTTIEHTERLHHPEALSYRLITFPLDDGTPPEFYLQIAVPMSTFEGQLERLQWIIRLGLPGLLLLAVLLGLYVSSRALRPVQDLIANTSRIDVLNLAGRVELPPARDEIRTLAETQNQMLDRIEKAFRSQERFIADASHQLLTPLTVLKGEIEIRLQQKQEDSEFLQSLLQETDKLTRIVKDMLLLARMDSGMEHAMFHAVAVDETLLEAVARAQKIAAPKDIHIKTEIRDEGGRRPVSGEEDLLFSLFFNILENAVKYSPAHHEVRVIMTWAADFSRVDILDNGPGIPADRAALIFERFGRAHVGGPQGFGLGLAIARKIAELHGFELSLIPSVRGAHFQITMRY